MPSRDEKSAYAIEPRNLIKYRDVPITILSLKKEVYFNSRTFMYTTALLNARLCSDWSEGVHEFSLHHSVVFF